MPNRTMLALIAATVLSTGCAIAFDSGPVRRAVEKGGNWLVGQYDPKTKSFGTTTAPDQLAMAVKALCDNPRDYKEANGPYISEPVKAILAKIDDKGNVSGTSGNPAEAALWVITGLKATQNDAYKPVIEKVRAELLTPVGLRSLSRSHPDYKAHYFGDLRARDAAYHQGTVWGWLIGPFIDAWLRVHPDDRAGARRWLEGLTGHLDHACVGSINEIFDAEEPYTPRGCIAQAWSVAEALRCWVKTATD